MTEMAAKIAMPAKVEKPGKNFRNGRIVATPVS
jgi:hypothetical protein